MTKTATAPGTGDGLWPTQTFTYGAVTVTVARQTVAASIAFSRVLALLPRPQDDAEKIHRDVFARMATQSVAVAGLEFAFPEQGAGVEAWQQAYADFQRMDGGLMNRWYRALEEVDRPPGERAFWPSHRLTEDERKNRLSAGSTGKMTSGATSPTSSPSAADS